MEPLIFKKEAGVATIKLNRPKAFNSVTRELALSFISALDDCKNDPEIRVIIITGEGKAFCAGQDLVEVTDPDKNPGFDKILEEHYAPVIRRIREIEKPVIAKVNGVAAGAGANIAIACDIVMAVESASFIQAFSAIGLIPDSAGTYFLPRLVGFQKASALAMLGDKVSAKEAEQMGMIYKYYPQEDFDEAVDNVVKKLAAAPTKGIGFTKRAMNQSLSNDLYQQLDVENELQIAASNTADYKEGVAAFVAKRKPNFKGA
ncbi:MAG: enoyl-CoA hydratase-related protein [Cyclobacteriaceae bacterium]